MQGVVTYLLHDSTSCLFSESSQRPLASDFGQNAVFLRHFGHIIIGELSPIYCTIQFSLQCTVQIVFTGYSVQYTPYSAQCTVYSAVKQVTGLQTQWMVRLQMPNITPQHLALRLFLITKMCCKTINQVWGVQDSRACPQSRAKLCLKARLLFKVPLGGQ